MTRTITPHDEALEALTFITGWWGGHMPIRLRSWRRTDEVMWRHCPDAGLASLVRWLDEQSDDEVLLGLPQREPWIGGVGQVSVLWARVTGPEQLERARKFKPRPSLAIQEGGASTRLLFWALEEVVPYVRAVPQCKRLAYHFRGVQKWGDPDLLEFCAPGTFVRDGRARPAPVRVARLTTDSFRLAEFETHRALKDPPPPPDWLTGR